MIVGFIISKASSIRAPDALRFLNLVFEYCTETINAEKRAVWDSCHPSLNKNLKIKKMNDCYFLSIEHREGEISPIYHCEINTGGEAKAIKIKDVYEKKYPHPYLMNGECMFCRPDGNMGDCPYYTVD